LVDFVVFDSRLQYAGKNIVKLYLYLMQLLLGLQKKSNRYQDIPTKGNTL